MVEGWPEEEEDYAVEDDAWEEDAGEIREPYDYGEPTPVPAEARGEAPSPAEARPEYVPWETAQPESEEVVTEAPEKEELDAFDYAWFAAPVLLGILGGLFGFFAVKDKKSSLGNAMVILGAISSLVWFASSYVIK